MDKGSRAALLAVPKREEDIIGILFQKKQK
jgi:hypothetical protein